MRAGHPVSWMFVGISPWLAKPREVGFGQLCWLDQAGEH